MLAIYIEVQLCSQLTYPSIISHSYLPYIFMGMSYIASLQALVLMILILNQFSHQNTFLFQEVLQFL